jgi:mRNA guanylyltransferase|tara:strand:+ start:5198 stop:6127 length:930 start_codon:yes stop_codon:yes gene_type:complete
MQRLSVKREDPLYKYTLDFMEHQWNTKGKGIFPGSQPISIEYRHFDILKSSPYVVCEKTDGVRFMMLAFMFNNKKKTMFVNRALEMFDCPLNFRKLVYDGTIVEGEMYGDTFMMYDMLMSCGKIIGDQDFLTRLDHMEKFKKMLMSLKYDPVKLALKTFHLMSDFEEFMDKYLPTVQQEIDGLIFTPINDTVKTGTHETMFKWKPRDKNTIDFQLKRRGDVWRLHVQERGKLVFESELRDEWVPLKAREWLKEDAIIECQYMFQDSPMWWKPVALRSDKTFPNSRRTFYRTLVNIREDIAMVDFLDCKP